LNIFLIRVVNALSIESLQRLPNYVVVVDCGPSPLLGRALVVALCCEFDMSTLHKLLEELRLLLSLLSRERL
jgi:hypothetical protein